MFTIDSHPGLALLRSGGLGGATRTRWEALGPEIDRLWAHFAVLGDLLERARAIRNQRRPDDTDWATLHLIVSEPVVGLDNAGMPTEAGTATAATRLRLGELTGQLEQRCVTAAGLIGGRALIVNAVDVEAAAFWARRGFLPSKDDPLVLFRSIADIAASLR